MSGVVLVTGATGLIGGQVVDQLLAAGRSVRVLARDPRRLSPDVIRRAQVATGDVEDRAAVARAVRGVGTVLHLAACARAWSRRPEEFRAVNVDAVAALLEAAHAAGVRRLVHVSTVLTLPALQRRRGPRALTPYEESKLDGERLVDRYAAMGGHAVVVHPARVYGPGPLNDANGVVRLVARYLQGPLGIRLDDQDVPANYIFAPDAAAGIILAGERGRSGRHYVLGGENASLREVLRLVGELSGVHRRVLAIPRRTALVAAHAVSLWGRLGGEVPITPAWVRCYFEDQHVDVTESCRELGYRSRSLRDGLGETIRWLRLTAAA